MGFIADILCALLGEYNQQSRNVVNDAQRKLNTYSSKYDNLSDEGKAKYDKLQSQISRAEKKCSANERTTEKFEKLTRK